MLSVSIHLEFPIVYAGRRIDRVLLRDVPPVRGEHFLTGAEFWDVERFAPFVDMPIDVLRALDGDDFSKLWRAAETARANAIALNRHTPIHHHAN